MNWKKLLDKLASTIAAIIVNTIYFIRKLGSEIKSRNDNAKIYSPEITYKPRYVNPKSQMYVRQRECVITHPENFVNQPAVIDYQPNSLDSRFKDMDSKLYDIIGTEGMGMSSLSMDDKFKKIKWF